MNPTKDIDLRKWAAEGLAYLTLDADVKEDLVADYPALRSLMDLARVRRELFPLPIKKMFCFQKPDLFHIHITISVKDHPNHYCYGEQLGKTLRQHSQMLLCYVLQAKDKGVLYPVAQILVNVTNSYDVKKIEPELVEIAKFAKQHIPETHAKVHCCLVIFGAIQF